MGQEAEEAAKEVLDRAADLPKALPYFSCVLRAI
jgi:hypothetical protein